MAQISENKTCSRCSSKALTLNDFGIDKNGDYFKTCNNCREYSNQRKANNREAILQQAREHYQEVRESKIEQNNEWRALNIDKLTAIIVCPCGGKYQHRWKADHYKTQRHTKYISQVN